MLTTYSSFLLFHFLKLEFIEISLLEEYLSSSACDFVCSGGLEGLRKNTRQQSAAWCLS